MRRAWIAKRSGGGQRPLGIPTVKDRVVQSAVYLVLMPIYEADFHDQSHGFRPKRRAQQAMEANRESVRMGRVEVLDADLSKFFDTIPHRQLMQKVVRRVSDGAILALIKAWLRAPIVGEDREGRRKVTPNRQGTPQGGVISPLLANIYLNPLDHQINESSRGRHRLIRYADGFVVLSPAGQGAPIRQEIESWLAGRGLTLNALKTRTVNVTQEAIRLLEFTVKVRRSQSGRSYPHVEASGESCRSLRGKVSRILNHHTQWRAIGEVVREVNAVMRGWSGYFHYGNSAGVMSRQRLLDLQPAAPLAVAQARQPRRPPQTLPQRATRNPLRTLDPDAPCGVDRCMKAQGQSDEWNSESRVRENRLHGLMRGRKRKRQRQQRACPRNRFSPTL